MAPLVSLLALLALATSLLASPHVPRNVHSHAHRAPALPPVHLAARLPVPLPRRKRSLNKRCVPRPANATSAAPSSIVPSSTAPLNVAPLPSSFSSLAPAPAPSPSSSSAADTTPAYTPPPAPTTTSSTSSYAPPPPTTTSSSPPPAQTSAGGGNIFSGQATYYEVGLGACGDTNYSTDFIVAVSENLFDNYQGYNGVDPNTNPVCGRQIKINYPGATPITVTVKDRCTGCKYNDLDLSQSAFERLASLPVGRIDITWSWAP